MFSIRARKGFSLVELVVVIVIIGIIAAMAIPRLSRGSAGASGSTLAGSLAIVRSAIEVYAAEHANNFPGHGGGDMKLQLTMYTDAAGNTSATKDATHVYGPYLVSFPSMPIGNKADPTGVAIDAVNNPPATTAGDEGWVYNPTSGVIIANTTAVDDTGKAYSTY